MTKDQNAPTCNCAGCQRSANGNRGMCSAHYEAWRVADPSRPMCAIDGCKLRAAARGMCKTHWRRWRKHGDPLVVLAKMHPRKYPPVCAVDECDKPHHAHGYCSRHSSAYMNHGDPLVVVGVTNHIGRPPKGGVTGYAGTHRNVKRLRGPASDHTCIECGEQAQEWAYMGGGGDWELTTRPDLRREHPGLKYSLDPDHYEPMCKRCHRRKDLASVHREIDESGRFLPVRGVDA